MANNGKSIIITGSTSGLGKVTAIKLAKEGAKVVVSGRRQAEGDAVVAAIKADGGTACFQKCDVSNEAEVQALIKRAVDEYGRLDGIFNNAGRAEGKLLPIHLVSMDVMKSVMTVNVNGVYMCMKYAIMQFLIQEGGTPEAGFLDAKKGNYSIVNCGSILGLRAMPYSNVYVTSKHAVQGLTKVCGLEYGRFGIRCNTVNPGYCDESELTGDFYNNQPWNEFIGGLHPDENMMPSGAIADATSFLLSDAAKYVSGTALEVSSGATNQIIPVKTFNTETAKIQANPDLNYNEKMANEYCAKLDDSCYKN